MPTNRARRAVVALLAATTGHGLRTGRGLCIDEWHYRFRGRSYCSIDTYRPRLTPSLGATRYTSLRRPTAIPVLLTKCASTVIPVLHI